MGDLFKGIRAFFKNVFSNENNEEYPIEVILGGPFKEAFGNVKKLENGIYENEKNNNNQSANKLIEQLLPNSKKKTKTETETENKLPNEENKENERT